MKIILHICCAVCATASLERLRQQNHQVSGYYYNPNIHPLEEYQKRLQQTKILAQSQDFPLLIGDYTVENWMVQMRGLEEEPEGGRRCTRCFALRLEETAKVARENGFDGFTTTLTVSPHKNAKTINEIGQNIGHSQFLVYDFKKENGFKKAQELSRQYNLYHQSYCGCIYSLNERLKYEQLHKETCASRHKD